MDWALSQPIPWTAKECFRAATVHIGGRPGGDRSIRASGLERAAHGSAIRFTGAAEPVRQHAGSRMASTRPGHTAGFRKDLARFAGNHRESDRAIRAGISRLRFSQKILEPQEMEEWDSNLVGGDIGGGALTSSQIFLRPGWHMYSTPIRNVFLCSSSTPPGPGVHGMCGFHAAERAKRLLFEVRPTPASHSEPVR